MIIVSTEILGVHKDWEIEGLDDADELFEYLDHWDGGNDYRNWVEAITEVIEQVKQDHRRAVALVFAMGMVGEEDYSDYDATVDVKWDGHAGITLTC